ncbi:hypothetical protein Glove_174g180 [Diversispora epigaea]|uniref:Uncharacterized protein n=1 Tax=Diversispora epigaea TaxID=1348612 RepID=A0A397INY7_9GLOM|nr:hypothetical protein Glove_174g180 [Diversispora epigaea]
MPSRFIYFPILLFFSPLIFMVLASFTSLAIFTSILAIIVITIRLGFLVVEFSGGVALGLAGWSLKKFIDIGHHNIAKSNINNKNITKNNKNNNNIKNNKNNYNKINSFDKNNYYYKDPSFNSSPFENKQLNNNNNINILKNNNIKKSSKPTINLDDFEDKFLPNNFISNDDYFMIATMGKRPNAKKAKSFHYV